MNHQSEEKNRLFADTRAKRTASSGIQGLYNIRQGGNSNSKKTLLQRTNISEIQQRSKEDEETSPFQVRQDQTS